MAAPDDEEWPVAVEHLEIEQKFDVAEVFALPDLTGIAGVAQVHEPVEHALEAAYYDTADLRLARARVTLRRRTGGTDAGWHVKLPAVAGARRELHSPAGRAARTPPKAVLEPVLGIVRRAPVAQVASLRTRRVVTELVDAGGRVLAEVADDHVTGTALPAGPGEAAVVTVWREVEVELVDGDAALLDAVERKLLKAGATPAAGPSKVSRALGGVRPESTKNTTGKINPVLAYARQQRDDLIQHDPGVRRGDPEAVHKMRVATRRLRSTLKTFRRSFPAAAELGSELKWLADLLGAVRDGQVQKGKLLAGVEDGGDGFQPVAERIRQHLDTQVEQGRQALGKVLESERYLALLDRVDRLADEPEPVEDDPIRRARRSLAKADGLLDRALADGVDAELHEARKAYKRARYAVEVFAPSGGKPAKQLVKRLTDLQDVLGAHQDSVVARELLHELGPDNFWFGVLWARQEQVGKDTHAELPLVVEGSREKNLRNWLG